MMDGIEERICKEVYMCEASCGCRWSVAKDCSLEHGGEGLNTDLREALAEHLMSEGSGKLWRLRETELTRQQ